MESFAKPLCFMFRAASRILPRRTILSASVAVAGVAYHNSSEGEKLSIYPSPTPEILLVEAPSPLEQQIGVARRKVTETCQNAHNQVQGVISRWIGVEHAIEHRVKSIISPNESLTPGLLYVGVATLTGSILARNRMLATRVVLPPMFFYFSAKQFLPETTANLTSYLGSLEETYLPTLAEKHDIANAHTRMTWERIKEMSQNGRQWVNRRAEVAVDKVQEVTGLKLKETLGWNLKHEGIQRVEEAASNIAQKAEDVKATVDERVEETKNQAIKKVEGVKRLV